MRTFRKSNLSIFQYRNVPGVFCRTHPPLTAPAFKAGAAFFRLYESHADAIVLAPDNLARTLAVLHLYHQREFIRNPVCTENLNPNVVVMKAAEDCRELMVPVR